MSKTQDALTYLQAHPDESVYSVAKAHGLSPTTLYTAINRQKVQSQKVPCPCCGTMVDKGKIK